MHDTDALTSHPASNIVSVDWKFTVEKRTSFSTQHTAVFVEAVRHGLKGKKTIMIENHAEHTIDKRIDEVCEAGHKKSVLYKPKAGNRMGT